MHIRFELVLLACSMVLVVFSAFSSQKNAVDLRRSTDQVERLNRVISGNERLLSSLKDLETGQRGYLLTGDAKYLAPFRQARQDIPTLLDDLRHQVTDRDEVLRVNHLAVLISQKRAEVEAAILVRDKVGSEQALALVKTDHGRESMDAIRDLCAGITRDAQASLVADSNALAKRQSRVFLDGGGHHAGLVSFPRSPPLPSGMGSGNANNSSAALDSARQHWQTTLLSIGEGVVATDAEGKVTFLNGAACRICGLNEQDALGRPVEAVLPLIREATRRPIEHPVHQVLKNRSVVTMTDPTILVCASGKRSPWTIVQRRSFGWGSKADRRRDGDSRCQRASPGGNRYSQMGARFSTRRVRDGDSATRQ